MKKIHTEAELSAMSSTALVALYNEYAAKPVKKFADKATAVKRTLEILPVAEVKASKKTAKAEKSEPSATGRVAALHARTITVLAESNPKRGESAERFALYRDGMTVGEYLAAGGVSKDVNWDAARGYISVTE